MQAHPMICSRAIVRVCNLALEELTEAMNRGWEKRDAQSALLLQQERAAIPRFEIPLSEIEDILQRT